MSGNPAQVVVISGLSGAGRSTAIEALEDLGFFCVDNLPAPVIEETVQSCLSGGVRQIGLGIDIRVRSFLKDAAQTIARLSESGQAKVHVLFLDAADEVLLRRFSSTRRPHPLSTFGPDSSPSHEVPEQSNTSAVLDGLKEERRLLAPLRALATDAIDTSNLSVHDLRRRVVAEFSTETSQRMLTRFVSFGFKYGPPMEADTLFDVRFLDNPFFKEELRPQTGLDEPVRQYVLDQAPASEFLDRVEGLLRYLLPRYAQEGKSYFSVGIGCTGGQHRSVAVTQELVRRLQGGEAPPSGPLSFEVQHRDIHRARSQGATSNLPGATADAAPSPGNTKARSE